MLLTRLIEAPQNPIAFASSLGSVNMDMSKVSAAGGISADPVPCRALQMFIEAGDNATPASREASVMIMNHAIKVFLGSKMSDSFPPTSNQPPKKIT